VGYELAAGERRLRAATNLGWTEIPVAIRELSDQELLAVALVENLQRSDLNPIEEAQGYSRLLGEFGLTQQAVADRVGKERSTVANMLRLLQLPAPVRLMVQSSELSLGHARALLGLSTEAEIVEMAKDVAAKDLSVREVERRVRVRKPTSKPVSGNRTAAAAPTVPSRVKAVEDQLRKRFQTDVRVALTGADKGTISIAFYSADDLDRVLDLVLGPDRERL
jgi:ParB family chromosome partitioning protein